MEFCEYVKECIASEADSETMDLVAEINADLSKLREWFDDEHVLTADALNIAIDKAMKGATNEMTAYQKPCTFTAENCDPCGDMGYDIDLRPMGDMV